MSRRIVRKLGISLAVFSILLAPLIALQPASAANRGGYAGNVDLNFDSTGARDIIGTEPVMATLSDGSVVVGSKPHDWGSGPTKPLVKFLKDGRVDTFFNANIGSIDYSGVNDGAVSAIVVTSNDDIIIGGAFNSIAGTRLTNIAKLKYNGTVDGADAFNVHASEGFDSPVTSMVIDRNDIITVGGQFGNYDFQLAMYVARIDIYGVLDQTYTYAAMTSAASAGVLPGYEVSRMALTPSGMLILMWHLSVSDVNGNNYQLLRIAPDGTYDTAFGGSGGTAGMPLSLAVSNSGNPLNTATEYYLIGGMLDKYSGQALAANGLYKVAYDGTLDVQFSQEFGSTSQNIGSLPDPGVRTIQVQSNGRIIVSVADSNDNYFLFRMNQNGTQDQTWNPDNITLKSPGTLESVLLSPDGMSVFVAGRFLDLFGERDEMVGKLSTVASFNVLIDPNDSVSPVYQLTTTDPDGSFTVPSGISRIGYTFDSWIDSPVGIVVYPGDLYAPTYGGNILLSALWTPTNQHVTYANGGGTGALPTQSDVPTGSTFTVATPSLSKAGYSFNGWSDGTSNYASGATYTMGASDVVLTATWNLTSQSVTYANGGGTGALPTQPNVVTAGTFVVAANSLTRSGYAFAGWDDGTAVYQPGSTYTMGIANVTLTAKWTAQPQPASVPAATTVVGKFDSQGGSPVAQTTFILGAPIVQLPTPTRAGYSFAGWFTEPAAGTLVQAGYVVNVGAVTLYARWAPNSNPIVFDTLGVGNIPDGSYLTGEAVGKLPTLTRSGFIFLGWVTDDKAAVSIDENYRPASIVGIKLKALWLDRHNQFKVRHLVAFNGASSEPSSRQVFKLTKFKSRLKGMTTIITQVQVWVPKTVAANEVQAYAIAKGKEVGKLVTKTLKIKSKVVLLPVLKSKGYQARHSWADVNVQFLK